MIYADNAATTAVSPAVLAAMLPYLTEQYGNPSSSYSFGLAARAALTEARTTVADLLHARPEEIFFTSGGTESDNQAIISAALAGRRKGKMHLISTPFEHHAVLHSFEKLKAEGFSVTLLDVRSDGLVRPEELRAALREDTALVSIMLANNEVGTLQPVAEIGRICRGAGVPFHTDAVQAAGHVPIDVEAMQIDMLSLSGHKFHAPKGVGALYVRKNLPVFRVLEGGGQERGKRPGTENVAGIVALAAALKESCEHMPRDSAAVAQMRDTLVAELSKIPHSQINGSMEHHVPGTVNICFEGIEGADLLLALDQKGVFASAGSACNAGSADPSHVLLAMGVPYELARGSLRLSIGEYNTPEEIQELCRIVPSCVAELRAVSPLWKEYESGRRAHVC